MPSKMFLTSIVLSQCLILGCGVRHDESAIGANSGSNKIAGNEAVTGATFAQTLQPVLLQNCSGCHGANQSPRFAVADAASGQSVLLQLGLVDFVNPSQSRIVIKIQSGHQNLGAAVADQLRLQVQAWASGLGANGGAAGGGALPLPTPVPLSATYTSIANRILQPKCVSCHGPTRAAGGYRYDTYAATQRSVKARLPLESKLYKETQNGSMPTGPGTTDLSSVELTVIYDWIAAGALNN